MGSGRRKAAAVNLLVVLPTPRSDTVSKQTAAASTIEISEAQPILPGTPANNALQRTRLKMPRR